MADPKIRAACAADYEAVERIANEAFYEMALLANFLYFRQNGGNKLEGDE